jgi:hypothetical protein
MNESDVRDERLAELLDRAVQGVQSVPTPERAIRRGDWRRAVRLATSIATAVVFLVGAIWTASIVGTGGPHPADGSTIVSFTSPDAPWAFEYPSPWSVRTMERAGPELRANILRTTVANVPVPQDAEYGPNSSANATSLFGDTGAVVLIERMWGHATALGGENQGPGPFADDAQNPGWTFRERARCDGTLCFHVIEWLGPATSEQDRAAAATIADSVRLANVERWTETDGIRTTLHDENDLFTVTYPNEWLVSHQPIQPNLSSPFEILALATYPLRPGGEAVIDFQLPRNAVEDLGPNDILIWLNDAGEAGEGNGMPARPSAFEPSTPCENWSRLCPEPEGDWMRGFDQPIPGIHGWWLGFHDAGRQFYVFVGMGEQAYADPARAQLAWDVLDSLRFLPR